MFVQVYKTIQKIILFYPRVNYESFVDETRVWRKYDIFNPGYLYNIANNNRTQYGQKSRCVYYFYLR